MKYYKDSFKRQESAVQSFLGKLIAVWSTPSKYMPIALSRCQTQGSGALLPAQVGNSAPAKAGPPSIYTKSLESNTNTGDRVEYCVHRGTPIEYSCKQAIIRDS